MKVLGIDPGYDRLGVAILDNDNLIFSSCIETSKDLTFDKRLHTLGQAVHEIITEYKPEELAIEKVFFGKNQKTAMAVSESRGAVVYVASLLGVPIHEYTPGEIKVAVTGYGKSSKQQVASMVDRLISVNKDIRHDDEYDAIAVGLTHLATHH